MSDTKNQPLQKFRDGAVNATLWEQTTKDDKASFVTVTISKSYKDNNGAFKEGKSFTAQDIGKLETMLPTIKEETQKWQDYYRAIGRAPDTAQPEKSAPTQQNDMVAQRDAAMKQAQDARNTGASPAQKNTQEHAPSQGEPER